jgi:hypothetical protein
VSRRFNAGNVHGFQLFHEADDVVELRAKLLFLIGRERKPREMRDVFDVEISSSHARKLGVRAQSSKFQVRQSVLDRQPNSGAEATVVQATPRFSLASRGRVTPRLLRIHPDFSHPYLE